VDNEDRVSVLGEEFDELTQRAGHLMGFWACRFALGDLFAMV
jgi:hypothetical protein